VNTATIKGTVFSGEGTGSQFVRIPWAAKQIKEKLGFNPYFGTLNIHIPKRESEKLERILKEFKGIKITPAEGFFQAQCFNVLIKDKIKGAIVLPEKPNYPPNVLEIIAPVHLRKTLSLRDSDEVKLTIYLDTNIKN